MPVFFEIMMTFMALFMMFASAVPYLDFAMPGIPAPNAARHHQSQKY
jgi:hypothetical protein